MSEAFYSASEAQLKLGLSKAMFFRKVKQGFIQKIVLPGMKQGVYPRREIDALAFSMQMLFAQQDGISFSRSTIADQVEELEIGARIFGRNFITPLQERIAFQQKSEYTFHSLKVQEQVVGYISMFNFADDLLDQLLIGEKIERDITVVDVHPFQRLVPFNIYIDVLVVDSSLTPHLQKLYGGILVSRFIDLLLNLYSNGYLIQQIYTVTTSRQGEQLVRKLGFERIEGKSLIPTRIAYKANFDQQHIHHLKSLTLRALTFGRR